MEDPSGVSVCVAGGGGGGNNPVERRRRRKLVRKDRCIPAHFGALKILFSFISAFYRAPPLRPRLRRPLPPRPPRPLRPRAGGEQPTIAPPPTTRHLRLRPGPERGRRRHEDSHPDRAALGPDHLVRGRGRRVGGDDSRAVRRELQRRSVGRQLRFEHTSIKNKFCLWGNVCLCFIISQSNKCVVETMSTPATPTPLDARNRMLAARKTSATVKGGGSMVRERNQQFVGTLSNKRIPTFLFPDPPAPQVPLDADPDRGVREGPRSEGPWLQRGGRHRLAQGIHGHLRQDNLPGGAGHRPGQHQGR